MISEFDEIYIETARTDTSNKMCSICLCDVNTDDKYETPCGHIFHKTCIESSYIRFHFCPYCRTDIVVPITITNEARQEAPRNNYQLYNKILINVFLIFLFIFGFGAVLLFIIYSV